MKNALLSLLILVSTGTLFAQGRSPFEQHIMQAPSVERPGRGSLSGAYGGINIQDLNLPQGAITHQLPLDVPSAKGPLLFLFSLTWSSSHGLTEWGQGWDLDLTIRRYNRAGEINFSNDWLSSADGFYQLGTDGSYYVRGMGTKNRLRFQSADKIIVFAENGMTYSYQSFTADKLGRNAEWHLTLVRDAKGRETQLSWLVEPGMRSLLTEVNWAKSANGQAQYRLKILHESIASDKRLTSYAFGYPSTVAARVSRIEMYNQGQDSLLWSYAFTFDLSQPGIAFTLTSVQKTFASGGKQPAFTFQYKNFLDHIKTAQFTKSDVLKDTLAPFGRNSIGKDKLSMLDINRDGRTDLVRANDFAVFEQGDNSFRQVDTIVRAEDAVNGCRQKDDISNPNKGILRLYPEDQPRLLWWKASADETRKTSLSVCDLSGRIVWSQDFDDALADPALTRIVDLDNDKKPEVVRKQGDKYRVWKNVSSAAGYKFEFAGEFSLGEIFKPSEYYFLDFNGDGRIDLVGLESNYIRVKFGIGNFAFSAVEKRFSLFNENGAVLGFAGFSAYFADINGDHATDLVLTKDGYFSILLNEGTRLSAVPLGQLARELPRSGIIIEDILGLGVPQIVQSIGEGEVMTLPLHSKGTGLLESATDSSAVRLVYGWDVADPSEGLSFRPSIVSSIRRETAGEATLRSTYKFRNPKTIALTADFLGFERVEMQQETQSVAVTYSHVADSSSMLIERKVTAKTGTILSKRTRSKFITSLYRGVPWNQLQSTEDAMLNEASGESTKPRVQYFEYGMGVSLCLSATRDSGANGELVHAFDYVPLDMFKEHNTCFVSRDTIQGSHPQNSKLDFHYSLELEYNSFGLPLRAFQHGESGSLLTIQTMDYDHLNRLREVRDEKGAAQLYIYDGESDRIISVTEGTGLSTQMLYDDDTELLKSVTVNRGMNSVHIESYAYDDLQRLSKTWDNLSGSSEASPRQQLGYRLPDELPGIIRSTIRKSAESAMESQSLFSGLGKLLGEADYTGTSWRFGPVPVTNEETRVTQVNKSWQTNQNPEGITFGDLLAGKGNVQTSAMNSMGEIISDAKVWQKGVTGNTKTTLAIKQSLLTTESQDNGIISTSQTAADGTLVSRTDADGNIYRYTYDALGRIRRIDLPSGASQTLDYDSFARPSKIVRSSIGVVEYSYESAQNLLAGKTFKDSEGHVDRTESMVYDSQGRIQRLEKRSDFDSETYVFGYDGLGKDQIGLLTSVESKNFIKKWKYRPDGALIDSELTLPGYGTLIRQRSLAWDGTAISVETIANWVAPARSVRNRVDTIFDGQGRVSKALLNDKSIVSVNYDGLGRVDFIGMDTQGRLTFNYDSFTDNHTGTDYIQDGKYLSSTWDLSERGLIAKEQYLHKDGQKEETFAYTKSGYLSSFQSDKTETYQYSKDGLKEFSENVDLKRDSMQRVVSLDDRRFVYGSSGSWLKTMDRDGNTVAEYIYDESGHSIVKKIGGKPVRIQFEDSVMTDSDLLEVLSVAGQTLGYVRSGTFEFAGLDLRLTPTFTASQGFSKASPYGQRSIRDTAIEGLIDFASKGYDRDSRSVRMGARDYLPELGQFASYDPLFFENLDLCVDSPSECNLYGYARNNPLNFTDPSGKFAAPVIGALIGLGTFAYQTYQEHLAEKRAALPENQPRNGGTEPGINESSDPISDAVIGGIVGRGLKLTTTALRVQKVAQVKQVATAAEPIYSARTLERMAKDKFHRFPGSFDKEILSANPVARADGRLEYLKRGFINDKEGVFHITLSKNGKVITHRAFVPEGDWSRFSKRWELPQFNDVSK